MSKVTWRKERKEYFRGWYFKQSEYNNTLIMIPGFHRDYWGKKQAFLQIIYDGQSYYIPFSGQVINYHHSNLSVRLGNCKFSDKGILLDIDRDDYHIHGRLRFFNITKPEQDIMGPLKYLTCLECRHMLYSMTHDVHGELWINDKHIVFNHGTGYIEGNDGCSFPERYVWTQSNMFQTKECSFMAAIANIPLFPKLSKRLKITGCLCNIHLDGQEYRLATYNGAKVVKWTPKQFVIQKGKLKVRVTLLSENSVPLKAPVCGAMTKTIYEYSVAKVRYEIKYQNKVLLDEAAPWSSYEAVPER